MGSGYRGDFGATKGALSIASSKTNNVIVVQFLNSANKEIKDIANKSPIKIPDESYYKKQLKKGYQQIKFNYSKEGYDFEVRWHTQTPNAPKGTGSTYQVIRKKKGFGYGKNATKKSIDHLIKYPSGKNKWVNDKKYQDALRNNKKGKATIEEKEIIKYGHIK